MTHVHRWKSGVLEDHQIIYCKECGELGFFGIKMIGIPDLGFIPFYIMLKLIEWKGLRMNASRNRQE